MQMEMERGGKLFFDLFVAMCNHMVRSIISFHLRTVTRMSAPRQRGVTHSTTHTHDLVVAPPPTSIPVADVATCHLAVTTFLSHPVKNFH